MKSIRLFLVLIFICSLVTYAQNDKLNKKATDSTEYVYKNKNKFNGPNSIGEILRQDNKRDPYYRMPVKYTKPWYEWKKELNKNTGIELGLEYVALLLNSSNVIEDDVNDKLTSSGILNISFSWNFINQKKGKNEGTASVKFSDRHSYNGNSSPMFHGLDESGYYGLSGTGYMDFTFRILELHYAQQFLNGRISAIIGKIDPSNYFNFHGLGIPTKAFINFGSIASGTVNMHNPGFGIGVGVELTESLYIKMALTDVYGDLYQNGDFLDFGQNFFNGDIQTWAEIGWAPTIDERFSKNFSLTFWHSPSYTSHTGASIEDDTGIALSSYWKYNDLFMPFFRFGFSGGKGENTFYKKDVQIGNGVHFKSHDLLGIALSWAEPNIPGSKDQLTGELFYRFQVTRRLAFTPDLQWILNPTLNPDKSSIWYFGARGRISL